MKPFEHVVAQHGPMVLRVCRAVVGPVDAEDAWSDTFLAALQAYPSLPADANVEAWLVTIAHRKALDVVRATARRGVPVPAIPEPVGAHRRPRAVPPPTRGIVPGADDWDGGLWDAELWEALRTLPPKQRQAVAYHYVAGFRYREIAEILGGSEAAARRAASDGIASLRRTLGHPPAAAPSRHEGATR